MNKQEAIERIESNALNIGANDFVVGLNVAKHIINQIDEPEKPVVPQFVADFYESIKYDFEYGLYKLYLDFNKRGLQEDLGEWFGWDVNKPIETLVKMKLYGYEVEKEKLYTVEIPNPNSVGGKTVLFKQQGTRRLILQMLDSNINKPKYLHLTEAEIKQDFEWAFRWAKEVEE